MRLFLNYLTPDGNVVWGDKPVDTEMVGYDEWLSWMVFDHKNFIFFYTTESTDVFFEEEVKIRQGFYNFEGLEVLEVRKDYTITTRRVEGGCRVYLPYGNGILNFTSNIEAARNLIDRHIKNGDTV